MTPERWARISEVFAAALDRPAAERSSFLDNACGSDESLRREVERLLAEPQDSWLKNPLEAAPPPELGAGQVLGRYRVETKLGQGGMGAVYKVHDSVLRRPVALKVLPPGLLADSEHKQRLIREARAASALNHPNIVTIHDVGSENGTDFIAMELVEGQPLDRMIPEKGLPLPEALGLAVQIAQGMVAAHGAGIVHRDLKPANVMVTRSGLVKLLDFGLAKRVAAAPGEGSTATAQGVIAGTVAYMSPEQAEGKPVDARSDIFSFGSVLYEMVSGRRAFRGETQASTLAAVISQEPAALGAEIPHDLAQVITHCLRKDPARRFQHMDDVKVALEELKEESDSGAPATHRRRKLAWAAGVAAVAALLGLGLWFGLFRHPAVRPIAKVSVFTTLGGVKWGPAFSPDGKQVAFVWDGEKQDDRGLYAQLVGEGTPRRLTRNPAFEYSPVWSPDGLHIAFLRETAGGADVLVIPAAGGAERRVHSSTATCRFDNKGWSRQFCGIAWSPDGKSLAVVDKESSQAPNSIFLLDIESREKRKLTAPPAGSLGDGLSAFSPDGRTLAFIRRTPGNNPFPSDIYVLPLPTSGQGVAKPRRITHDSNFIMGFDWTADGRGFVFSSARGGEPALWRIAASGGEPERLPVGSDSATGPSVPRKGDRLAYVRGVFDFDIWRVALPVSGVSTVAGAPAKLIYSPAADFQPAFSPDGHRVAFASNRSGNYEIWVCGADGSSPARLTYLNGHVCQPAWSPDGRRIACAGWKELRRPAAVYVVGAEGGTPHRLTTDSFEETDPCWSRDGKWIHFLSDRGTGSQVWKAPADGGPPLQLTRKGAFRPIGSVDGKSFYYRRDHSIWWTATEGGEETSVLETGARALWGISESGIYILDPDARTGPAIEFFRFDTRARTHILKLEGGPDAYVWGLGSLAVSPDQRWILYEHRGRNEADIMLVENFR